jgi:hypothetical protein
MLLIRPDVEQSIRNRIAAIRETPAGELSHEQVEESNMKLAQLEKSLDDFKNSAEFKKISEQYWADNDVQLSTMTDILQEVSAEMGKLSGSAEKAAKLRKDDIVNSIEKRKKELSKTMEDLLEFTPAGAMTGELVRVTSEAWEKAKGAKAMIEILQDFSSELENESAGVSKKLDAEKKRLARLETDAKGKKSTPEMDAQRAKIQEIAKQDSELRQGVKQRKGALANLSGTLGSSQSAFKRNIGELAAMSKSSKLTEGSGRPLKELMLAYSLPFVRAMAESLANKMPRNILVKRQEDSSQRYEELREKYEKAALRAKSRAKCKRCREAIDSLLSGAVDHDSPEVRECVRLLEDGDIFEARKALERAFLSGNIHEYVRVELDGMMKELAEIYDDKGEVSGAEQKLMQAGCEFFRARLDLMRLDYIMSGVHSPKELWLSAFETFKWLGSAGIMFEDKLKKELETAKGKIEFMALSDTRGFSREQLDNAENLMKVIVSEANLLEQVRDSDAAKGIYATEARIAAMVSAGENFENPLYLKSLASGDQNAVAIRDRTLQNAAGYSDALKIYLDAAIKKEVLENMGAEVGSIAGRLSKVNELCSEIGRLKAGASKPKSGDAIGYKLSLGRKTKELEELLRGIVGGGLDEALLSKLSEPKLEGEKLYAEIIANPTVKEAVRKVVAEQGEVLGELAHSSEDKPIGGLVRGSAG